MLRKWEKDIMEDNLFGTELAKEDGKIKIGWNLDGHLLLECSLSP